MIESHASCVPQIHINKDAGLKGEQPGKESKQVKLKKEGREEKQERGRF